MKVTDKDKERCKQTFLKMPTLELAFLAGIYLNEGRLPGNK